MLQLKKRVGTETRVYVSPSVIRMSTVRDSKGHTVFRGIISVHSDPLGILVFLDMFPDEPWPHLCRFTFVRVNGQADVIDASHGPALDMELDLK